MLGRMKITRIVALGALLAVTGAGIALVAERGDGQTGQTPPANPPGGGGGTAPMPPGHPPSGGGGAGQMPPGHPPTGGGGAMPSIPPPPADSGTGKSSLTWTAPPSWTKETPSSGMRRAQYKIPGPGGAAECVVFYFGPGQGGDASSNVERWAGQFRGPDGKPVGNTVKKREIKVGDIPVVMVEVTGTYVGGMGSGPAAAEQPNHMLLGAIADGPDARWFFRATGPKATLEPQRAAFDKMIRSIKRGS
jgi:hypothetical protein